MYFIIRNTPENIAQLVEWSCCMNGNPERKYIQWFPEERMDAYFIGLTKETFYENLVLKGDLKNIFTRYQLLQSLGITKQDELASLLRE